MQQAEATSGDPARPLMVDTWSKAPDRALDDPNLTPFDKVLLMKLIQVERRWVATTAESGSRIASSPV